MEGRPIRGEGLEHEQDYIQERIEQAGDTDEYAHAAQRLEDELQDLQQATSAPGTPAAEPGSDALLRQAQVPVDRLEVRQGSEMDPARGGVIDPNQQPPEAEARAQTITKLGGGTMGDTSHS